MSKAEETADAPKKSKKKLLIIVVALVVVLGGAAGAYFTMFHKSGPVAPVKGPVAIVENPLTINLADAHYLKLGLAIQETADGSDKLDTAEAQDIAISTYTGMTVADLSTDAGREAARKDLLTRLKKAYNTDGKDIVMDVYFTAFVTQ